MLFKAGFLVLLLSIHWHSTLPQDVTVAEPPIKCSSWLPEYVKFHQAERLRARRLVVHCDEHEYHDGGLGDRLRAVLSALQIAAAHNLILMANFTGNFNLTDKLQPARIDWTPVYQPGRDSVVVGEILFDAAELAEALVKAEKTNADVYVCSVMLPFMNYGKNITKNLEIPWSTSIDFHWMWSELFQPAPALKAAHALVFAETFNTTLTHFEYVAVHIRVGGLTGEDRKQTRVKSCNLAAQFAAQKCALELSRSQIANSTNLPILFVTDNNVLRWAVSSHLLNNTVGPRSMAVHISHTHGFDYMNEYVDVMLLAGAKCLLVSSSGYSNLAYWWGGQACLKSIDECIDEQLQQGLPSCERGRLLAPTT